MAASENRTKRVLFMCTFGLWPRSCPPTKRNMSRVRIVLKRRMLSLGGYFQRARLCDCFAIAVQEELYQKINNSEIAFLMAALDNLERSELSSTRAVI